MKDMSVTKAANNTTTTRNSSIQFSKMTECPMHLQEGDGIP